MRKSDLLWLALALFSFFAVGLGWGRAIGEHEQFKRDREIWDPWGDRCAGWVVEYERGMGDHYCPCRALCADGGAP